MKSISFAAFLLIASIGICVIGLVMSADGEGPVCGSDGITYKSQSALCDERKNTNKTCLTLYSNGACNATVNQCSCSCDSNEQCGSDGNTYGNDCLRLCAATYDPCILFKHQGICTAADKVKVAYTF